MSVAFIISVIAIFALIHTLIYYVAFKISARKKGITCNECGFNSKENNIRKCPVCGNPLK